MIREIYNYRELLLSNIKKNIRGKYKASALGVLWSFVNPLLQVLVYAIVFPYLLRNTGDNYLIYLVNVSEQSRIMLELSKRYISQELFCHFQLY